MITGPHAWCITDGSVKYQSFSSFPSWFTTCSALSETFLFWSCLSLSAKNQVSTMPAQDKTPGDVASSPASSERPLSEANSSAASLNRSTSAEDASSKRAAFGRSTSGSTTTSPSRPRLTSQTSRDGSIRQRRASYRRQSSFDLAHTNSLASVPDIKRLEALDMSKGKSFTLWLLGFSDFITGG